MKVQSQKSKVQSRSWTTRNSMLTLDLGLWTLDLLLC
jgi:hypothetical protein